MNNTRQELTAASDRGHLSCVRNEYRKFVHGITTYHLQTVLHSIAIFYPRVYHRSRFRKSCIENWTCILSMEDEFLCFISHGS